MNSAYLGTLAEHDPLHGYLRHDIQPQVSGTSVSSTTMTQSMKSWSTP
jgi:hypothetical protein